jgi:hypothetical protein
MTDIIRDPKLGKFLENHRFGKKIVEGGGVCHKDSKKRRKTP